MDKLKPVYNCGQIQPGQFEYGYLTELFHCTLFSTNVTIINNAGNYEILAEPTSVYLRR